MSHPALPRTAGLLCAALLAACGGGSPPAAPPPPVTAALVRAQPGELTAFLAARVRARLGQGSPVPSGLASDPPPPAVTAAAQRSGTLVQEDGVDEDDLIKADGDTVYTLHAGALRRDRLGADGRLERLQSLALEPAEADLPTHLHGLYLAQASARAVVLGTGWRHAQWQGGCGGEVCIAFGQIAMVPTLPHVMLQPVSTGSTMVAQERIVIDGRLVGSRRVGQRLVVVSTHVPALAVEALPPTATTAEREAALAALRAADLLPRVRVGGADAVPLVAETDCYLQPGNGSAAVEITTITVFDLASPALARQSRCFVGGSEGLYMAAEALYLATTRWTYAGTAPLVYPAEIGTDVHKFGFDDGGAATYRASGTVTGHLGWDDERKSYRFSEWGGHLRVLSYTGRTGWATAADSDRAPSPATLTLLREDGSVLREVARLPNAQRPAPIGKPDEQIYGVRFVEDRGYVVTFRQVDPLYVLDLSVPADPRTAGALELPGFSRDLFALGSGWLLGVGNETDADGLITGVKLALFDVRDPARPLLRHSRHFGGPGSTTALDHSRHGLNLLWRDGVARISLPMALWQDGAWLQGLQRLEVDATAGTTAFKELIEFDPRPASPDVSADRSLQIGERLIYLSQGRLGAWDW